MSLARPVPTGQEKPTPSQQVDDATGQNISTGTQNERTGTWRPDLEKILADHPSEPRDWQSSAKAAALYALRLEKAMVKP